MELVAEIIGQIIGLAIFGFVIWKIFSTFNK